MNETMYDKYFQDDPDYFKKDCVKSDDLAYSLNDCLDNYISLEFKRIRKTDNRYSFSTIPSINQKANIIGFDKVKDELEKMVNPYSEPYKAELSTPTKICIGDSTIGSKTTFTYNLEESSLRNIETINKKELSFNNYLKKYENLLIKDNGEIYMTDIDTGYVLKFIKYRSFKTHIESIEKHFEKFCLDSRFSSSYRKVDSKDKLKFIFDLCEYYSKNSINSKDILFYKHRTDCLFRCFYNNLWNKLKYICDLLYDDYIQIYTPMIKRVIDVILKEDNLENIFANFVEVFDNNYFKDFIKDFELVNKVSTPLFNRHIKKVEDLVEKVVKGKVSYPERTPFEVRMLDTYFDRIIKGEVNNICNPNFDEAKSLLEIYYSCFSECHLKDYKMYDDYVVKQLHKLYRLFNQNNLSLFVDKADNTIHKDEFSEFYLKNIDMKVIRDFILRFCHIEGENKYRFKTIPGDEFSVISYRIIESNGFKELVKNIDDFIYVYEKRCSSLKECQKAYKKIMESNLCSYVENDRKLVEVIISLKEVKQKFLIISVETIDEIINKEVNGLLEYVYSLEDKVIENTFSLLG